jgi:hypothetical protein
MHFVRKTVVGRVQVTVFRVGLRSKQVAHKLIAAKKEAAEGAVDCPESDPVEVARLLAEIKKGQTDR